jgi:hypothetical protein
VIGPGEALSLVLLTIGAALLARRLMVALRR